ncbi:Nn.00g078230.m01.CDS01 [Neocucurbitaria sp. VM-36]
MTATSGTAGSGDPDMVLIGELLEEISRRPAAVGARKLLVEHYLSVGWLDAAMDNAKELKSLAPKDSDVIKFLQLLEKKPLPPAPEKRPAARASATRVETREWDQKAGRYKKNVAPKASKNLEAASIELTGDLEHAREDLTQGYQALRARAKSVLVDLLHLQALQKQAGLSQSKNVVKIEAIVEGHKAITSSKVGPPGSARSVARTVRDTPKEAVSLIITDFESTMTWIRAPHGKPSDVDNDTLRDTLVKRKAALESFLPDDLKMHCELALMHIEHENLERNYANTETMLGDEVKDIPRENFYVTEDNYAWDMDELVQAIKANSGVLRNPLSKEMFTPKDVKGILIHPLGKPLAALAVEQHEMSKGVRIATIEQMEKLSKILLEDQSADTLPSRKAVDEFLAYIATLPDLEQKAIDGLKCPAKDNHTGQSYDFSIGESVRDAKGNRVCFHKTGDFIKQAAEHLRQNRGVVPDPDKCVLM